jgi:sodium-dependent dicarboxylate transporter 2/3/5
MAAVACLMATWWMTEAIPIPATCAFMLPVATPPNAIVFGFGYVTISQMVKSGFGLNVIGIVIAVAITLILVLPVFGVQVGVVPGWAMTVVK